MSLSIPKLEDIFSLMKEYNIESYQDGELLIERKSIELYNADLSDKQRKDEQANKFKTR